LRYPVIALLFQRGKFDVNSTNMVAWALLWYTVGLVGHSVVEILSRAFYALHDTRTPVIVGTIAMSLNIVFSFAFSALFASLGWMPHGGLALAMSFATALEMSALFVLMRRRLKGLETLNIGRGLLQAALATAVMSGIILGWLQWGSNYSVWIVAPVGIIAGGMVYALMVFILRVPEVGELIKAIQRRLKTTR